MMVREADFEEAVRRIARVLGRTCSEQIHYRRRIAPFKGKFDYRPREGTVEVNSLGSSRYIVFLADKTGGQGPEIVRGSKRDILDFSHAFAKAAYYIARPRMKKLKRSVTGNVWGHSPRR